MIKTPRESRCFFMFKRGESVKIKEIIKNNQPEVLSKLKKNKKHSEKFTEKELKELMSHSSYRRVTGGAIRQMR